MDRLIASPNKGCSSLALNERSQHDGPKVKNANFDSHTVTKILILEEMLREYLSLKAAAYAKPGVVVSTRFQLASLQVRRKSGVLSIGLYGIGVPWCYEAASTGDFRHSFLITNDGQCFVGLL